MEFVNETARTDGHEVVRYGILPQIFVVFESRAKLIGEPRRPYLIVIIAKIWYIKKEC